MAERRSESPDTQMDFWDHLAALRPHLVRGALAVFLVAVAAFFSKGFLIDTVLFGPRSADFPTNRLLLAVGHDLAALCGWINSWSGLSLAVNPEAFDVSNLDFRLVNTQMAGQFNLHLKISLVSGFVLAMPYVLWEFWRFVKPALTPREIAAAHRFVFSSSACFFLGLLFGYFVLAPLSVTFFINYRASSEIVNMIDVGQYLSTVLIASLASALLFQLPLLVYFLTRMGVVSSSLLRRYRRHAFIALLVVSAIITPPDIFSLVLVIIPVYGLYELSIRLAARIEHRRPESIVE